MAQERWAIEANEQISNLTNGRWWECHDATLRDDWQAESHAIRLTAMNESQDSLKATRIPRPSIPSRTKPPHYLSASVTCSLKPLDS